MERPNVLLVVMDTARARNALPSKNPDVVPHLADFVSDGVEFTSAISTAPWTLPSHASMFTGQYTSDHGTNAGNKQFAPTHRPLARRFQQAGYTTVAFSNNSWVSPEFGFEDGFDDFHSSWEPFSNGGDLTSAMREYDDTVTQIRALFESSGLRGLPATVANAAYAKFLRKRYDYGATLTNWKINRWLDRQYDGTDPFFMFINYLEPHLEYDPPKKYCTHLPDGVTTSEAKDVEQDAWGYVAGDVEMSDRDFEILEGLYDSELGYLDHRIGELFDDLESRDLLDDTFVVVVGDHGENIGDHGLMDHQYCLYDTLVHVPLLIRGGAEFRGGKQVTDVVESRDIFPTLLEAAGIDGPKTDTVSARSLFDVVREDTESNRAAISEYLVPQPAIETLRERAKATEEDDLSRFDRALRTIRTARWKFIEASDGSRELYDLESDPDESENVISARPEVAERLRERLVASRGPLERGEQDTDPLDAGTQERLEDLGYI